MPKTEKFDEKTSNQRRIIFRKKKTSFEFVPIVDISYILNSQFRHFSFEMGVNND
jgi:hypothetical protein